MLTTEEYDMKKLTLLSALILGFSVNAYADNNTQNTQSVEPLYLAEASQADDVNNALRLKFISRRAAHNPAVNNKDETKADTDWQGATYVDEKESDAAKRLNRQFKSKRPYINYNFE
jgi:hypothetical protein